MKIEHTAYQVSAAAATAQWYVTHLGLTIKRAQFALPFGHFLSDDGDTVMLEFYSFPELPVPDYRSMDPRILHLAFRTSDVAGTRARLLAAGASAEGDVQTTDAGDTVAMLRDPWGLCVQLVRRRDDMIP